MKKTRIICLILIFTVLSSLFACDIFTGRDSPREKVYFEFFDTVTYIYDYSNGTDRDFDESCEAVSALFSGYHKLFDIYNEYSGINNLCTVNKNAGNAPVSVDEGLIDFLLFAKDIYGKTNGKTNVMMGSVLGLWHEARENAESASSNSALPTKEALTNASEHTSIDSLVIDSEAKTVCISDPKTSIDAGAIAKGYAAEMAARELEKRGVSGYVLDVGGNLRIIGQKPDGNGWYTGIRNPKDTQEYSHYLTLSDTSCVTSGDYERYFTYEGKNYHHIIDNDTLMPAEYFSSVTVITPDSGIADALSTALFCVSYEEGVKMLEGFEGVEVIWIKPDGEKLITEGLK